MSQIAVFLLNLLRGLWARPPVLIVLVLNLVPAACVLWLGWSALVLLLLYWAENVVIGAVNVLKMAVAGFNEGVGGVTAALFLIPFFVVHYGLFCLGHGFFVVTIGGGGFLGGDPFAAALEVWKDRNDYLWALAGLAAIQLAGLVDWFSTGAWRQATLKAQMAEPYGRIIVLHLTIIFGAVLVALAGEPAAGIALLAVLKTIYETVTTARRMDKERQAAAAAASR